MDQDLILQFAGTGLLWGIIITSGPYLWALEKLHWGESVLECALCTGTWIALCMSIRHGFDALNVAVLPLCAEWVSRWIRT